MEELVSSHTHDWYWVYSCGASVCMECSSHAHIDQETNEIIQTLARCFCGWAADGEDGREQLLKRGENLQ